MRKSFFLGLLTLWCSFNLGVSISRAQPSVEVQEGAGDLGELVVSATLLPELLENSPHTVEIVTGEKLEDRQDRSVVEGLRELPGVSIQTLGTRGESANVKLRGATGADTLVLLDGVRLNNPGTGDVNLSLIPIELIDQIEVLKGSQAVLYGGSAVGGVVNITTKRGTPEEEFRLLLEGGNLGHRRELLTWTGSKGRVEYALGVSRTDDEGQFFRDDYGESALTQRWDVKATEKLHLTLTSRILLSEKQLARGFLIGPPAAYDPNGVFEDSDFLVQLALDQNRVFKNFFSTESLKLVYDWSKRFRTELLYGFYLSKEKENDSNQGDAPFTTPLGLGLAPNSVLNHIDSTRHSADLRQFFFIPDLGKIEQTILAGFEFYDERTRTRGETFPGDLPPPDGTVGPFLAPIDQIPQDGIPGDRQNYAPYLQYHIGLKDRFYMDAGFRWDFNSAYGNELSPRVAMAVLFSKIGGKLHGAYGEGFLPPTIYQLVNSFSGDPTLKPQTTQSYELGYVQQIKDRASLFATYFYLDFDNLIGNRLGGQTNDAFSTGVESGFEVSIVPEKLTLGANYTFTKSEDESETKLRLENIPNHVLSGWISARPWKSLKIDTSVNYVGSHRQGFPVVATDGRLIDRTVAASLDGGDVPGYTRWDMAVSYDFDLKNSNSFAVQKIKVFGKANNILNRTYEESFGFPSPRFNFFAGAELLF